MSKLLLVTASPRYAGSHSRMLAREFLALATEHDSELDVVERDLFAEPPVELSNSMIHGFFNIPGDDQGAINAALSVSNRLTSELMSADTIVIATPMYNFNVPAPLKAWIDLVIRSGITFEKVADGQLRGLCSGKRILVLCAMGGRFAETRFNLVEPYFRLISEFIGVDQVEFLYLQGTSRQDSDLQQAVAQLRRDMLAFIQPPCVPA